MDWSETLIRKAQEYNFEPCKWNQNGRLYLIFPKMPSIQIQKELRGIIPETVPYEVVARPRMSTEMALAILFKMGGVTECPALKTENNTITMEATVEEGPLTDKEADIWQAIEATLHRDPYVESWKVLVNGQVMSEYDGKKAKMIEKAVVGDTTDREKPITDDDLMNLKISLGKAQDVNDFINSL